MGEGVLASSQATNTTLGGPKTWSMHKSLLLETRVVLAGVVSHTALVNGDSLVYIYFIDS